MAVAKEPVYYWSYLHLDELLSAQQPLSDPPAHDELLFIVVHQAFELWFKQILFELDAVLAVMGQDVVAEKAMGEVVAHLMRITKIQRLLTDQIEVLETMTPLDFLEFRDVLIPASGFQSVQFRLIENKFGLDTAHRLRIKGMPYTSVLSPDHATAIEASEREPSLHDHLERWLRRTPFLSFGGFDFWRAYREALALGNTRPLPELFEAAGARFQFDWTSIANQNRHFSGGAIETCDKFCHSFALFR